MRNDGRQNNQLRPISITRQFTKTPAGSILWKQGDTIVLCTASIAQDLPPWMKDDRPGVDMNVACTARGKLVEIQAGAENGEGFDRSQMNALLDLAVGGCQELMKIQRNVLA
jgi:ribonuclease PH